MCKPKALGSAKKNCNRHYANLEDTCKIPKYLFYWSFVCQLLKQLRLSEEIIWELKENTCLLIVWHSIDFHFSVSATKQ